MNGRRQSGFTLIELLVAMVLLGIMMLLLYSGLTFALRSWDAGEAHGRGIVDRRIGENFLRRELTEVFPMRWKDPMTLKFAFEGEAQRLKFVSSRPAGVTLGGLSLVGLEVEQDADHKTRHLTMRRAMPDDEDGLQGSTAFQDRRFGDRQFRRTTTSRCKAPAAQSSRASRYCSAASC